MLFIPEVDTAIVLQVHTLSSAQAKRGLETRVIHSVGLSSYPLNVAVQSCPCV